MKKIFALAAVAMLALTACGSNGESSSNGVNGTFEGQGAGINGNVTATLTIENSKIVAVELDCSGETPTIGQAACQYWLDNNTIVEAQGYEFDKVAGATVTSKGVKKAVKAALVEAGLETAE